MKRRTSQSSNATLWLDSLKRASRKAAAVLGFYMYSKDGNLIRLGFYSAIGGLLSSLVYATIILENSGYNVMTGEKVILRGVGAFYSIAMDYGITTALLEVLPIFVGSTIACLIVLLGLQRRSSK